MRHMRTKILSTIMVLSVAMLLSSCDFETSGNGNFDGYWKMTTVDTLATGGTLDLTNQSRFWSVEHKILMINNYMFRFKRADGILTISEGHKDNLSNTKPGIDDFTPLHPYGIHSQPEVFNIDHLSKKRMVLSNDTYRLSFKKF